MSLVDRLRKEGPNGTVSPPNDEALEKACPLLWEMLTVSSYRKGEDRILPEVRIKRLPGAYEIVLQDHETCQQIAAVALRWADLAAALEMALGSGTVAFRPYKSHLNPKGLKRHEAKRS